jgi:Uma2 family endonuclease
MALAYKRYTYDDYVYWDGDWELIDGFPYAMAPSPIKTHQALASAMIVELSKSIENCKNCLVVGELDYKIDEYNVLRPDVAVICNEESDYILKAPKIVVEVVSPSTAFRDEKIKKEIYEKEGVKYYILIYQNLYAKVFENKDFYFFKVGDFESEVFRFSFDECEGEIDFKNVFKRFRK